MAENPIRFAAPTAATPASDTSASEGRTDPHGIHWMRGAPPIDAHMYGTIAAPVDLVAASVARKSDSSGAGTGTGRRASGFLSLDGGMIVFVTGAGNTESWTIGAGVGCSIEMTSITSYSGTQLLVFW